MPVPAGSEYRGTKCPRSDRNLKEGFEAVDAGEILARVAQLPISLRAQDEALHHENAAVRDRMSAVERRLAERSRR